MQNSHSQDSLQPKKWIAGYNMAGYMPETDPVECDSQDEAKRYIIWVIKEIFEEGGSSEAEAEDFCAFAEEVNLQSGEFSQTCRGWAFWVRQE